MATLSELSSRLFRDVQANHAATMRALDDLEQERRDALRSIPGAPAVLERWRESTIDAESARDLAVARVELDFSEAERDAGDRRRAALTELEERFKDADAKATAARAAAEAGARRELEAELARIAAGQIEAGEQVLARSEAHHRYTRKLEAAAAGYHNALASNRNSYQDELRAADVRELADIGAARDRARAMRDRAQQLYERALKAAETRMRAALESVPGASDLQANFDARRERIKRESREREAALFAAYQEARRQLTP